MNMQIKGEDNAQKSKGGRPSIFSQEIADKLCAEIAEGKSLRTICDHNDSMPDKSTVFRWLRTDVQFCDQYAKAKEEGMEAIADEMMDIADDGHNDWMEVNKNGKTQILLDREHVERSKLRIDTRKWILAKIKPKKYGDKIDMTTNGKELPMPILAPLHALPSNNSNAESNGNEGSDQSHSGGNISLEDDQRPTLADSSGPVG